VKSADALTLDEIKDGLRREAEDNADAREADALALQFDKKSSTGSDSVTESTHADVDAAAPGVISKSDYQAGISVAPTTVSTSSFDQIFNDLKTAFMTKTTEDVNLAVAACVKRIIVSVDELQALAAVVISETTKISVAAAAGLLSPPSRTDIEELKADGQHLLDEMSSSSADLRSGRAMRRAALGRQDLLENNREDMVGLPSALGQSPGRVLEELEPDASRADDAPGGLGIELFAPPPAGAPGLAQAGERQNVADRELSESSKVLQASVLSKVSYLAICQALSVLETGDKTRDKAQKAYIRLQEDVKLLAKTLSPDFNNELRAGSHELVAKSIDALGAGLQSRLNAWDQFLSVSTPKLPTFVSTVENIGDQASNVSFVESLLASCGLRMDSFCDAQGMLEVARSLDKIMGLEPVRFPKLGKSCFTLAPPDPNSDYQTPITRPDREAKLLLAEAVQIGGTQVKARFSRADVKRALTTPVPQLPGTLATLTPAGSVTVTVAGLASTPADVGSLRLEPGTPQEEILRYQSRQSSGPNYVFTLIDKPVLSPAHGSGSAVFVDGEHRDDFSDVYQQRQEIGGGPGQLRLAGDNEAAETLAYSGSIFNSATGVYTFTLDAPGVANLHQRQASGRPSTGAKKILFRDPAAASPAPRFKIAVAGAGLVITPVTPGSPADMTSEIISGNLLVLSDDVNETPVEVLSVTAGQATLTAVYHNYTGAEITGFSLAKVDAKSPAGSTVKARFSQRALDELGVNGASFANQVIEPFQILLDQDNGTRNLRRGDGAVVYNGAVTNRDTLNTSAPIFEPGDNGKAISVQSRAGRRLVPATIVYVGPQQVHFNSTAQLTGTVSANGTTTITGVGTKFGSEVTVGDFIALYGVRREVTAISDNLNLTVDSAVTAGASVPCWIVVSDTSGATARNFSFIRSPRETCVVSSVQQQLGGGLWVMNLTSPSTFAHGTQQIEVNATIQTLPQSQLDFLSQPTSVTPRFEPDIVPPGTLKLRGSFDDQNQASILGPLLASADGVVEIGGLSIPYDSLAWSSGDTDVIVSLTPPGTPKAFEAGTTFCVPTSKTIESLLDDIFATGWDLPAVSWLGDLDEQMMQLHRRLCRLLQGRPEDLAIIAASAIAGAGVFSIYLLSLRIALEAVLLGLGEPLSLNLIIGQARDSGMDKAAEAMSRGDMLAVAQMSSSEATTSGSLLVKINVYREKLTTYDQSVQADSLAAELKGNQTSVQVMAEMRAGFKVAAAGDISRKTEAAKALSAKVEVVTR
jgi:hypothetical protein